MPLTFYNHVSLLRIVSLSSAWALSFHVARFAWTLRKYHWSFKESLSLSLFYYSCLWSDKTLARIISLWKGIIRCWGQWTRDRRTRWLIARHPEHATRAARGSRRAAHVCSPPNRINTYTTDEHGMISFPSSVWCRRNHRRSFGSSPARYWPLAIFDF